VTRYDDVRQLFSDSRVSADPRDYERYKPPSHAGAERWLEEMPFRARSSDPQMLGRRLVSAALTPRAVTRMERQVAEVVEEYAAPLRGRRGIVDLIGDFTAPVARTVIGRILGVPPLGGDEERFRLLAVRATRGINPILGELHRQRAEESTVEICEYMLRLVAERRQAPARDLISDLVRASDSEAPATEEDVVRVIASLVSAGTGTTSLAASRALRSLLEHPEHLGRLRDDPSLVPQALEELLRHHSGLFVMPRYVVEEFELRGRPMRRGQLIALSLMGANRDPQVFSDPDRIDFDRDTKGSLAFGYGPHYCIGANLARATLRLMISAALEFLPGRSRVLESEIRWSERGMMSQMKSMPVDFAD
jgi:cytochrome P450